MIVVQQLVDVLNAKRGDETVNGFANGEPLFSQSAIISGALHGEIEVQHLSLFQFTQRHTCGLKILILLKALQDFAQDQIADQDRLVQQETIQILGLRRNLAVEIIDPDRGIYEDHG